MNLTWNPNDRDQAIILSEDLLSASVEGTVNGVVRATVGHPADTAEGKYFEILIAAKTTGTEILGAGVISETSDKSTWIGIAPDAWGIWADNGKIYNAHSSIVTGLMGFTTGSILRFAVKENKLWVGLNSIWIGSPELGTGFIYSNLSGIVFPTANPYVPQNVLVLHGDSTSLTYPPPTGFSTWGEAPVITSIGGVARKLSGSPIDLVVIREFYSHSHVSAIAPSLDGSWTVVVPPGEYDVSYLASGCAPIIHGPYLVQ